MQTRLVSERGVRVLVFDRRAGALSMVWSAGAKLYRARGLIDRALGASSWQEALDFVATWAPEQALAEVQFWGHGKWGDARIGDERFDVQTLRRADPHAAALSAIARRVEPGSLFWFRTCETLGAVPGQHFAASLADRLGCRVAGHTYIIDALQSGLHALDPGRVPDWEPSEGVLTGTPERPLTALRSTAKAPRTITCFEGVLPDWA